MNQKMCDRCYQKSFSSRDFGLWLCPICGKDITYIKSHSPEERRDCNGLNKVWKSRRTVFKEQSSTFSTII